MDYMLLFLMVTNQKVVGFDVTMDQSISMDEFNSLEHLKSDHGCCFDSEFSLTVTK
jgi:hypothetical protein